MRQVLSKGMLNRIVEEMLRRVCRREKTGDDGCVFIRERMLFERVSRKISFNFFKIFIHKLYLCH